MFFKDIVEAVKNHFWNLLKYLTTINIGELMKVIRIFPILFGQTMNEALEDKVSMEELKANLQNFKRAESLGPNG